MSLISKEHLRLTIQSLKDVFNRKIDKIDKKIENSAIDLDEKISDLDREVEEKIENSAIDLSREVDEKIKNSTADWNENDSTADSYIKNRPFYEESEYVTFIEEQTITLNFSNGYTYPTKDNEVWQTRGQIYKIIFDGVEYQGTVWEDGDASYRMDFTTNDGYYITVYDSGQMRASSADLDGDHTVAIYLLDSVITKIPEKYLPETIVYEDDLAREVNGKMDKSNPVGTGSFSMNRKSGTTVGTRSVATGYNTTASGQYSHAEGYNTQATTDKSATISTTNSTVAGYVAHAEGYGTVASGAVSHAEGNGTTASGISSHAEGWETTASGDYSYAEGYGTTASGRLQRVIGKHNASFLGYVEKTKQVSDFDIGSVGYPFYYADSYEYDATTGRYTLVDSVKSYGSYTFPHGKYIIFNATSDSKMYCSNKIGISSGGVYYRLPSAIEYSAIDLNQEGFLFVVGNGDSDTDRSNAHTLDWDGNAWYAGDVYVGSTSGINRDEGSKKLATEEYANNIAAQKSQVQFITWEADD